MADGFIIDNLLKDADQAVIDGNAALPGKVRDRIANQRLVERDIFDALPKYSELKNELNKLSKKSDADVSTRGPDGKFIITPGWKPETVKKIQEAEKRLNEFKQAYLWAVEGRSRNENGKWIDDPAKLPEDQRAKLKKVPDYEPLKKAMKGGGSGGGSAPAAEEAEAAAE